MPTRAVRLVVIDVDGVVQGITPDPIPVATPWWPEAWPVVEAARQGLGLEVAVLRLLETDSAGPAGGLVTYLVEGLEALPASRWATILVPWTGAIADHPRRQPWARPGGPRADLAWANRVLDRQGRTRTGPAEQIRSWNLSSLWRIPVRDGNVWLKHVPSFFQHEGAVLEHLAGDHVPVLLGRDAGRVLMEELRGEDLYVADTPVLEALVRMLVDLQVGQADEIDELLGLGLPDWRPSALTAAIRDVVLRTADRLDANDQETLAKLVEGLPDRFDALSETGLPNTLVHGDFHPGNARGSATDLGSLTLLDWGDSGIGHPLLDQAAFLDRIPAASVSRVRQVWDRGWRDAIPGSDPARAAALLAPVAAARQAAIYRMFLDHIEPSEHPYHRRDPERWLARAADLLRKGGS
ncbi:MAG: aminoglycoside phosphotransferase family protein [Chloroflexi bacterium]|nr:aminoglycoside phosphotransferase family protein [Chloroflexota bacterium]